LLNNACGVAAMLQLVHVVTSAHAQYHAHTAPPHYSVVCSGYINSIARV